MSTVDPSRFSVSPAHLRWRCDPDRLGFETTNDFTCRPHIIGQDRALDAIRLGLEMHSPGYNIYISGLTGTGKTTAIKKVLESMDLTSELLKDLCFVHNFKRNDNPVCITMPAGQGCAFAERMKTVRQTIRDYVPEAIKSEQFRKKQSTITDDVKKRRNLVTEIFEKEISEGGFSLVEVDHGTYTRPEVAPVVAGEAVTMDSLPKLLVQGTLGKGDYEKMQTSYPPLVEKLDEVLEKTYELERELESKLDDLRRKHIQPIVTYILAEVRDEFKDDKITRYLEGLEQYIVDHLEIFIVQNTEISPEAERVAFLPFDVNVLVDNTGVTEAPVVIERSPNYSNLFGTIERIPDGRGEATIDFTCIRAGSLHRAAGGYLILNLNDLFEEPNVWVTLKRSLKNESHEIRGFDSVLLLPVTTIKPEAIDLDVKVILIGDAWSYQVLYEYDEDFEAIFKVKAEFDSEMPNHRRNLSRYAHFIKNLCTSEGLLAFHKTGVATVIEEGVRMAGRQSKLTTKFSDISDVVREANYWARRESARVVRGKHVRKAIDERTRRVALYEDKMQEAFDDGTLLLDTRESGVGQVNGLAVYDTGDHAFGKPNRITAETGVGRAGVINIEREAEMSGRLHTKGMLILEGYLRRMYAQDKPITMTASICFEQAYSGIDGDSASSTEIYALLSSIAGAPLRQDLAVTGSVNQKGEIQPIGGVNEKIEGFFDVCRNKGLTGTQGVMIPALNKRDLMLRAEVVEAVRKGKFHIYAIDTIDNGIEILTGLKAGRRLKNGGYTKGSMHDLVDASLHRFHKSLRHSENGAEDGKRKD